MVCARSVYVCVVCARSVSVHGVCTQCVYVCGVCTQCECAWCVHAVCVLCADVADAYCEPGINLQVFFTSEYLDQNPNCRVLVPQLKTYMEELVRHMIICYSHYLCCCSVKYARKGWSCMLK